MLIPKKSLGQNFLLDKNLCKKIKIEFWDLTYDGVGLIKYL